MFVLVCPWAAFMPGLSSFQIIQLFLQESAGAPVWTAKFSSVIPA